MVKRDAKTNGKIVVFSLLGVVVFFALCALVSWFINTKDIGLGKELEVGVPVALVVDGEQKAIVTVYSARELSESEAISAQISANGKTVVAVKLTADILDSDFRWGANCMRVRDSAGKYGEVVAFRNGYAYCRIENPSDQISFFIYTGNWTTNSSLKSTGRYKLPVDPAPEDPVEQTRRALEENRLDIQGLTMELEEGFQMIAHLVKEDSVWLEYEDMILTVNIRDYENPDLDEEMMLKRHYVGVSDADETTREAGPAGLPDARWYNLGYVDDGTECAVYFFAEGGIAYKIVFYTEEPGSLDSGRIAAMMETATVR